MPKIVDHDIQRQAFAEATIRIIARSGFEGVTMRAVSAEAGLSYGSLFHYFSSKDELLAHAVRHAMALQSQRADNITVRFSGLEALSHLLCDDAVVDETSRENWLVWSAFLYKAALQPSYRELHEEMVGGWLARITRLLRDAQRTGELAQNRDIELEAKSVWALSAGIGQLGLLDPVQMPAGLQRRLIAGYLDRLRAGL